MPRPSHGRARTSGGLSTELPRSPIFSLPLACHRVGLSILSWGYSLCHLFKVFVERVDAEEVQMCELQLPSVLYIMRLGKSCQAVR